MRIKWFSNWTNLISLHPRMLLCQIRLKSAQRFWRRSLLYFVNIFLLLNNYPPWKKGGALLLNKLDSHHPRMLCAKFGWNRRNGLGEEDFWFLRFRNYLPWKRTGPFIWTNLNPLFPKMHCTKFGWNLPVVLEEKIIIFRLCISVT